MSSDETPKKPGRRPGRPRKVQPPPEDAALTAEPIAAAPENGAKANGKSEISKNAAVKIEAGTAEDSPLAVIPPSPAPAAIAEPEPPAKEQRPSPLVETPAPPVTATPPPPQSVPAALAPTPLPAAPAPVPPPPAASAPAEPVRMPASEPPPAPMPRSPAFEPARQPNYPGPASGQAPVNHNREKIVRISAPTYAAPAPAPAPANAPVAGEPNVEAKPGEMVRKPGRKIIPRAYNIDAADEDRQPVTNDLFSRPPLREAPYSTQPPAPAPMSPPIPAPMPSQAEAPLSPTQPAAFTAENSAALTGSVSLSAEASNLPPIRKEPEAFVPAPKDDGGLMTEAEAERAHEMFEAGLSADQREQRGTKREQIYEQIKRGELHITALKDMTVT